MTPVKIILILLLVLILRAFLVQRSLLLIKRFFALLLCAGLIGLVILPDLSTKVANFIGVGRGADLIFYFSHLLLLLLIISLWRRILVCNREITILARRMAIENVKKPEPFLDANQT